MPLGKNPHINKKRLTLLSVTVIALIILSSTNIIAVSKEVNNNISYFLNNSYSQLYCVLPSNAIVGQPIRITIEAWDWAERICKKIFSSVISFSSTDNKAILPKPYSFKIIDSGVKTFENSVIFNTPGIHYVIVRDEKNDIYAVSNPVKVTEEESEYKWYWGELHCHSDNSDGRGTLDYDYTYARDISMLDFCSYSDHVDFWWTYGGGYFNVNGGLDYKRFNGFEKAKEAVNKFYEPGKFVTLLSYEYSSSLGHHNAYFNTVDDAECFPIIIKERDKLEEFWELLKDWKNRTGHDVFTIPHHLISENMGWDTEYYDPEMVPLVEIYQYRGSSEMLNEQGNPVLYYDKQTNESGHSVQDALAMGYKVGFMAGSDDHEGHPGHHLPVMPAYLTEPSSYRVLFLLPFYTGLRSKIEFWRELRQNKFDKTYTPGGITGVFAKSFTREEIFNSLKDRKCIAVTNVNRMIMDFSINGQTIGDGSEVYVSGVNSPRIINCSVAGTAPISNITVVKNNQTYFVMEGLGQDPQNLSHYKINFTVIDKEPITGMTWDEEQNTGGRDVYYIRVLQTNKGAAWMGPIWVNSLNET